MDFPGGLEPMRLGSIHYGLTWRGVPNTPQTIPIVIELDDGRGGITEYQYDLEVGGTNNHPEFTSIPTLNAWYGYEWEYTLSAIDADGHSLTYKLLEKPAGMVMNGKRLTWTPNSSQNGKHGVKVTVEDGRGGKDEQQFAVQVSTNPSTNHFPVIGSNPIYEAVAEVSYQYQLEVTDPDNDLLFYDLPTSPDGMSVSATGLVSWTPTSNQLGIHGVAVRADDGNVTVSQAYTIQVQAPPPPALINKPNLLAFSGTNYRYRLAGFSEYGGAVSVTLQNGPPSMTITPDVPLPGYYELNWVPDEANCQRDVTLELTDSLGKVEQVTFTIDVYNAPKRLNRFQCSVDAEFCATR